MLRHREEAEDAAQDVFATAFEKLPKTKLRHSFRAWLWTAARNRAIDILRRQGRLVLEETSMIERRKERPAKSRGYVRVRATITARPDTAQDTSPDRHPRACP